MKLHKSFLTEFMQYEDGPFDFFGITLVKSGKLIYDENEYPIEFTNEQYCSVCFEKIAIYGFGTRRNYCEDHKTSEMNMNYHRPCQFPECEDFASIGSVGTCALYCKKHFENHFGKKKMIKFCLHTGCDCWAKYINLIVPKKKTTVKKEETKTEMKTETKSKRRRKSSEDEDEEMPFYGQFSYTCITHKTYPQARCICRFGTCANLITPKQNFCSLHAKLMATEFPFRFND